MRFFFTFPFRCCSDRVSVDLLRASLQASMAFLLNRTNLVARHLRSHPQNSEDVLALQRRGFHVEPGPREKALLAPDPALSRFKSYKKSVKQLKRISDVLTVVVVAGCCYEIYVRATTREEARGTSD